MLFPEKVLEGGEYVFLKPDVSEEEFWELANEDSNFELVDGVLMIHSPASKEHEEIFLYLSKILGFFLEETNQGQLFGSRFVMRLSEKWNPEPDIMIITPSNYNNIKENMYDGPANIVIEILSKSTKEIDLNKKLPKYLEAGVEEVWIIDPFERSIKIHSKEKVNSWVDVKSDDKIKSKVLLDVPLKVKWLWNRTDYPANEVIKEFLK
ncbi:MAG: Uma2 family endonuclease [Candidatus Hodarchaeota archaeon]